MICGELQRFHYPSQFFNFFFVSVILMNNNKENLAESLEKDIFKELLQKRGSCISGTTVEDI